jgi:hypothetical protein
MAVAALTVVLHVRSYTTLSPLDELQHLDYLERASHLRLTRQGDLVGEVAMREQACRTIDSPGFVSPPCNHPDLTPQMFQEGGINTAATHPPTYYFLTGVAARAAVALPGLDSFLGAGRLVGAAWVASGIACCYLLARRFRASPAASAGASLLLMTTPAVMHAGATVTNDAPSLLASGLVCLAAVSARARRSSVWWFAATCAFAVSIKFTNIVVVGAMLLVFLLARDESSEPVGRGFRPGRIRFAAAGLVLLAALLPAGLWTVITSAIARPDAAQAPMQIYDAQQPTGIQEVLGSVFATTTPIQHPHIPAMFQDSGILLILGLLNVALLAALVGAAWFGPVRSAVSWTGLSVLIAMLLTGPFFVGLLYFTAGAYYPIPARYGLSLLVPATAVMAWVASYRRGGSVAVLLGGLLSVGLTTLAMW